MGVNAKTTRAMAATNNPPAIAFPAVPLPDPAIGRAARNVSVQVIDEEGNETTEKVYLKSDEPVVDYAYQSLPGRASRILQDRGEVVFCLVLQRVQRDDNRVVFMRTETVVAVKKLRLRVIQEALDRQERGGDALNENPYAEISAMQHYGDDQHVMRCYEALQDDRFLYIVTRFAPDGDLYENIEWRLGGGYQPRHEIPVVAKKLLKNLLYLQEHHLVHRDWKPENLLSLPPWYPLIDCAMALQIVYLEENAQLIVNQGAAGSPGYVSPEVFSEEPFNHKADLWAFGCVLFNLLTGLRMYDIPLREDESYMFLVLMRGIENEALCDRVLEELIRNGSAQSDLGCRVQAVQVLDPLERNLLQALLQPNPDNRPTVEQVLQHPFFQNVP